MARVLLLLCFALLATACGDRGGSETRRSFPIFEGTRFGFMDADGEVTVPAVHEYWGTAPGAAAVPNTGPDGRRINGTIEAGGSVSGGLATSTGRPAAFWLLPDGANATSVSINVYAGAFSPELILYEYRDGSWNYVRSRYDNGQMRETFYGANRNPLGVLIRSRTYYTFSYPTNWLGGSYSLRLAVSGRRPVDLGFLDQLRYAEGRARFRSPEGWGFLAPDGTVAVPAQYDDVGEYSQGRARVMMGGRQGYIDRDGKLVIAPQYDSADDFSEGLAQVTVGERCGFIDPDGRYRVNPSYRYCDRFHDNVAIVADVDGRVGAVDPRGEVLITPQFEEMTRFAGRVAGVKIGGRWGLVDRRGTVIVTPQFDGLTPPIDGELWLAQTGSGYGFIDGKGAFVVPPIYSYARPFRSGLAAVQSDARWGFIRPDGQFVGGGSPSYDEVHDLIGGHAAVKVGELWGFVDAKGELKIAPAYEAVGDFDGALAAVVQDGQLGYITTTGVAVEVKSAPAAVIDSTAPAAEESVTAAPADEAAAPVEVVGTTRTVRMVGDAQGYRFEPANLTVKTGDAVRFEFTSGGPHNVAFDGTVLSYDVKQQLDLNFSSKMAELSSAMMLVAGESVTVSFAGIPAGQYAYNCTPHLAMGMKGIITVQ